MPRLPSATDDCGGAKAVANAFITLPYKGLLPEAAAAVAGAPAADAADAADAC